jgi:hypothetical protein
MTRSRTTIVGTVVLVFTALALLLAAAPAHAQARQSKPDELRITAKPDPNAPAYGAVVTASGRVGRRGDADATTLAIDLHAGTVIVTALPRSQRCPKRSPGSVNGPHRDYDNVYEARYSETLAIADAFDVGRKLRLCGYLTAKRHTSAGVRTVTVARASTTITGAARDDSSGGNDDLQLIFGGIMAWVFVIGFIAALVALGGWLLDDTPAAARSRRNAKSSPPRSDSTSTQDAAPALSSSALLTAPAPAAPGAAPMRDAAVRAQAVRPLRRAKPRDVIQDAVDAIADTYRDRLVVILEHQDGPGWLHALNERRRASMTRGDKGVARPYEFLEPRAVLNCLAYDSAGLQLISAPATAKARQLSGLVNEAHHPRPDAPLTEDDGYRAWKLYTDITGHVPIGDPFER